MTYIIILSILVLIYIIGCILDYLNKNKNKNNMIETSHTSTKNKNNIGNPTGSDHKTINHNNDVYDDNEITTILISSSFASSSYDSGCDSGCDCGFGCSCD